MKSQILLIIYLFLTINLNAQTIQGKISSCAGKNLVRSDIQIISNAPSYPQPIVKTIHNQDPGTFKIDLGTTGYFNMRFCSVDYQPLEIPIFIDSDQTVMLDVKLKSNFNSEPKNIKLIGGFNDFSFEKGVIDFKKNENGVFEASVEAKTDTFSYQIVGLSDNDHSINYTQSDYYALDNGGDYHSVIKTNTGETIKITIDPSKINFDLCESSIEFKDENSESKYFYELLKDLELREHGFSDSLMQFARNGGDRNEFRYDWSGDIEEIKSKIKDERNEKYKAFMSWGILRLTRLPDKELSENIMKTFNEESAIWSVYPPVLFTVISELLDNEKQLEYLISVYEKNPDNSIKPYFLSGILFAARGLGKTDLVKKYYEIYAKNYSDERSFKMIKAEFAVERKIQVGVKVPEFVFTSVDDSSNVVTRENMLGKIYLIDFWATWCAPCIAKMENLHNAYKKYNPRGLQFISVSMDRDINDMIKFRKEKWALPWFNSFLKYNPDHQIVKDFELMSIPKPVLVDQNGIIIAADMDLRGDRLEKTFARFFNE